MTTSSQVPGRFACAINGRPYMFDPSGFRRQSLPVLREQSDISDLPSERSLNPRGPWRRSAESWHHGAGQTLFDGKSEGTAADPERFADSTNVDIWTRGQLTLLPMTVNVAQAIPTTLGSLMLTVANHLYAVGGDFNLYWASNPTTTAAAWTSSVIQAGEAAQAVQSLASDGYYVWAALGTSGLHRTTKGAATSTANVPAAPVGGNISLVGYALDRLIVGGSSTSTTQRNTLWEVLSPIGAPALSAALMTHHNPSFVFTGITPGRNCIYVFGNGPGDVLNLAYNVDMGATGEVYKIALNASGTALGAPSAATYLPDGESIFDVRFYAGGVILATSRGLRLGQADGAGNIDYGPLITVDKPVLALEPQDRYVWFTGDNEGIHRADLGYFTDPLTPGWAPDLQCTNLNSDTAIVKAIGSLTSSPNPVFLYKTSVAGAGDPTGIYRPSATVKRVSGSVESGQIRFGTTEVKKLHSVEVQHAPLPSGSSVGIELRINNSGAFGGYVLNTNTGTTSTTYLAGAAGAFEFEVIEVKLTMTRSTDTLSSPTITRWTIKAIPAPLRSEVFQLPLLLHSNVVDLTGTDVAFEPEDEIATLKYLELDTSIVEFQVGASTFEGYIESSEFEGKFWSQSGTTGRVMEGTYTVTMVTTD